MPRRCVFCGKGPVTREHVLAKWISEVVAHPDHPFTVGTTSGWPPGGGRWAYRKAGVLDLICKQVCRTCNGGWMAELEGETRPWLTPMIRGIAVQLPPEAQAIIARWAVKTSVMFQYVSEPSRPVAPERLQWLLATRDPPPNAWVCLAGYAGDTWTALGEHRTASWQSPSLAPNYPTTEFLALSIGHLVLQTLVWPDTLKIEITIPADVERTILRIWPPTGSSLWWPPVALLDDEGLIKFIDDFIPFR